MIRGAFLVFFNHFAGIFIVLLGFSSFCWDFHRFAAIFIVLLGLSSFAGVFIILLDFYLWSNEYSISYRASYRVLYKKITLMYVSLFPIPHTYFVHQRQSIDVRHAYTMRRLPLHNHVIFIQRSQSKWHACGLYWHSQLYHANHILAHCASVLCWESNTASLPIQQWTPSPCEGLFEAIFVHTIQLDVYTMAIYRHGTDLHMFTRTRCLYMKCHTLSCTP